MTLTLATPAVTVERVWSPAPRAGWEALVAADPTALVDQEPDWLDLVTAGGPYADASRLYELSDGRRFVLPLVRRRGLGSEASMPEGWGIGGLVGPDQDEAAVAAVLDDLATSVGVVTRVRPDPLDGHQWEAAAGPTVVRRPRLAHVLDLTPGLAELRAGLRSSTRNNLNKAERAGLEVTDTATPDRLAAYYGLYELSLRRWAAKSSEPEWLALWRGRRRDPLAKLESMAAALGGRFRLWMAWRDGEAIAGAIVLLGRSAHYTRGSMDPARVGKTAAPVLLQWRAIEEAVAAGCPTYHFGDTGTSSSLAQFKEGFGARPVAYADHGIERLPVTRLDRALRTAVKRTIGFRDGR